MKKKLKLLIAFNAPLSIYSIYNGKENSGSSGNVDLSEIGFSQEINKIKKSLSKYFTNVKTLSVTKNIKKTVDDLEKLKPELIFNFVESVEGVSTMESCLAGIYELLNIAYTGNDPIALGNCLNKERTKNILRSFDIKTPASFTLRYGKSLSKKELKLQFPVITKLLTEDASIGISENSVVNNLKELEKQINVLQKNYKQDIIIEEYIEGRELNVAILGKVIMPISEIDFSGLPNRLPKIVTYESKWVEESIYYKHTTPKCPAKISSSVKNKIEKTALAAFEAMGCRDYARVDIRLSKDNIPYVIEVNPNPDISTDSGFVRAAKVAGISYNELLYRIASFALERGNKFRTDKNYDSQNKAV